jgi:hypothetical protein
MIAKKMASVMTLATILALPACSHPVIKQDDAVARIDSGEALNARPGTYRVADVKVTMLKIVTLPGDMLGLRFSFVSGSADCCSLFPRAVLDAGTSGERTAPSTTVVLPQSYVGADGTLAMRLSENGEKTVPFTIDLHALGVPLPQ